MYKQTERILKNGAKIFENDAFLAIGECEKKNKQKEIYKIYKNEEQKMMKITHLYKSVPKHVFQIILHENCIDK